MRSLSRSRRQQGIRDPLITLSGSTLQVYMILLTSKKPLGIREIQRIAGFRSPNSVRHHLDKLLEMGYVVRSDDGYVAVKPRSSILSTFIILRELLIPKSLFYAIATTLFLLFYIVYRVNTGIDWYPAVFLIVLSILLWRDSISLLKKVGQLKRLGGIRTRRR